MATSPHVVNPTLSESVPIACLQPSHQHHAPPEDDIYQIHNCYDRERLWVMLWRRPPVGPAGHQIFRLHWEGEPRVIAVEEDGEIIQLDLFDDIDRERLRERLEKTTDPPKPGLFATTVSVSCREADHVIEVDEDGRLTLQHHGEEYVQRELNYWAVGSDPSCRCAEIMLAWSKCLKGIGPVSALPRPLRRKAQERLEWIRDHGGVLELRPITWSPADRFVGDLIAWLVSHDGL
jgi:hypothetical protein